MDRSVFEEFSARQRTTWGSGDWPDASRNEATDGSLRAPAEYLLTVAEIAG